jgi:amino acid transporter
MINEIGSVIFCILWILSVFGVWIYYRRAYSPGGLWDNKKPEIIDFVDILMPVWNTIIMFIAWVIVGAPIKDKPKKERKIFNFFQWFYQIKKEEENK